MRLWHLAKWTALAWFDGHPDFAAYRTLMLQEKLGAAELEVLRLAKARSLVAECLAHVPYYGELMLRAGITPESIRSPGDLAALPLLDKAIIRREASRMLNAAAPKGSYFPHTTGGSSGMPLDFFRGRDYDKLANAAANMRSFGRMGWRPGDRLAKLWAPHEHEVPPRGIVGTIRRRIRRALEPPETFLDSYATSAEEMAAWIPLLRSRRPRFLYGYASNLALFARFLRRQEIVFDDVRGIASTATTLFPSDRQLLGEAFPHAIVIDIYGSREVPGIATECRLGAMHVNSDLVHVEYLPVADEPGKHRLIVTALDNTIFPFIRYDIGDYGSPRPGGCGCGLPFPAMDWGTGKILDSFLTPDGRVMTGGFFEDLMYLVKGVHAYQFRQKTEQDIVLFLVPSEDFGESTREHLAWVEDEIHRRFSPQARLHVEHVNAIPLTPAGKHQFVVSEIRNPSADGSAARHPAQNST